MENVEYKVSLPASVSAIYRHLPWTITSSHHPTSHFLHLSLHQTSRRSFSLHNTTQHIATHPPPPPPHPTHVHAHSPPFHLPHLALRLTDCANTRTDHRSQIVGSVEFCDRVQILGYIKQRDSQKNLRREDQGWRE